MLKPLNDRIIVQIKTAEQKSKGGIILPDSAKEKPQEATVLSVGPGKLLDNGKYTSVDVKEGDRVLFGKYAGTEVKINGEEFTILRADDILAVLEG